MHTNQLNTLSRDECLRMLRTGYVGRVGYVEQGRPVIVTVNFAVTRDGTVGLWSGEGRKLEAARAGEPLCLQADGVDGDYKTGWCVNVTGVADVLEGEAARAAAKPLMLRPWVRDVERSSLIMIRPDLVEGRRLQN